MGGIVFSRTIHDRIHGIINLTEEEMAVIDNKLFQRLRRTRQTGMLYLVMPSSVQTRFEHSIGTMYMADRILKAVFGESRKVANKLYSFEEAEPGQALTFSALPEGEYNALRRALRLTALVHDLGHGPLSHTFDAFAPGVETIERILTDPRLAVLTPYKDAILKTKTGRVKHEAISVILFATIWHSLKAKDEEMPRIVASVLLNTPPRNIAHDRRPWIPFIRDIVSSAPIDADRMDYLLRDSTAMGVTYGLYEKNRIFKSALCVKSMEADGGFRLGWRDSGLPAIDNFVQARYQMFRQLYTHKTYRATELMLAAIGEEARKEGLTVINTGDLDTLTQSYSILGDDYFMHLLRGEIRPDFPGNARVSALAVQVGERKLWKRVIDCKNKKRNETEHLLTALQEKFPEETFFMDELPPRAMKDIDRGGYLLTLDENIRYSCKKHESVWLEASPIMAALFREETDTLRIYMETKPDGTSPNARKEALRLSAALRRVSA